MPFVSAMFCSDLDNFNLLFSFNTKIIKPKIHGFSKNLSSDSSMDHKIDNRWSSK